MDTIAKRIEFLLHQKNDGNQSEMARFVGVSPQAVQKWIAELSEPRGKNLTLAAEFLGVSPAYLQFGGKKGALFEEKNGWIDQEHSKSKVTKTKQHHHLIEQVIELMESTDDEGKEAILVAARTASHTRMVQRAEIEKIRREIADIQTEFDASGDDDGPVYSRSVVPARKVPKA